MHRTVLLSYLAACSGTPSEPSSSEPPEAVSPRTDEARASPVVAATPAPAEPASPPSPTGCDPEVTEVLFVPDDSGFSVTILGEGFCMGAAPPSARFGDVVVTGIVVSSAGDSMAGRVERMPSSGAALEIHTPPGSPVVTRYTVR